MEINQINHVLIVEDDKEIREGVEIYLRSQGYEVFQAAESKGLRSLNGRRFTWLLWM